MNFGIMSAAMSGSMYIQNQIPQYLLSKMLELGLDTSNVQSASEARALIQQAEAQQKQQAQSKEDNKQGSGANNSGSFSNESPVVRQKAVELAEKVGITVSQNQTIDDILNNIQNVLDKLLKAAADDNDEGLYNTIVALQRQLDSVKAEANGTTEAETKMYSFMDMLAAQNKFTHNLNN